ncbi:MAG: DUF4416 family protein [Planctomycetota bacterium]
MKPLEPTPVKLFCGILYSDEVLLRKTLDILFLKYGSPDYQSVIFPFEFTAYYEKEMGLPINRVFYSFSSLINPVALARIKVECIDIETQLAVDGKRKVNLDPGYMDVHKVVLASAKFEGHKVYLDQGIYADPTLRYAKGHFTPMSWCFPDFRSGHYEKPFLLIRERYKIQLKSKK